MDTWFWYCIGFDHQVGRLSCAFIFLVRLGGHNEEVQVQEQALSVLGALDRWTCWINAPPCHPMFAESSRFQCKRWRSWMTDFTGKWTRKKLTFQKPAQQECVFSVSKTRKQTVNRQWG